MKNLFRRGLDGPGSAFVLRAPHRRAGARTRRAVSAAVEPLELRVLLSSSPAFHPNDANGNAPTVMFSAANVNSAGQASEAITLTFTDSAGISPSSVNTGNITVTNVSTSATLTVMGVTLDPSNGVAGQVTAVYDVAAPDAGSVFTSDDDGAYSVVLGTDQVSDSFNDQAPQTTGAFNVEIPPPGATAPTASITAPSDVTAAGTSSVNVTVVYAATAGDGDASTSTAPAAR
jgi:hypothetical protein